MTSEKKAIEFVNVKLFNPESTLEYGVRLLILEAIKIAAKNNWIDASKELPNNVYEYLVTGDHFCLQIGFYEDGKWYNPETGENIRQSVTHWANLPQTPEK